MSGAFWTRRLHGRAQNKRDRDPESIRLERHWCRLSLVGGFYTDSASCDPACDPGELRPGYALVRILCFQDLAAMVVFSRRCRGGVADFLVNRSRAGYQG